MRAELGLLGNDGCVQVTQHVAALLHQAYRLFEEDVTAGALPLGVRIREQLACRVGRVSGWGPLGRSNNDLRLFKLCTKHSTTRLPSQQLSISSLQQRQSKLRQAAQRQEAAYQYLACTERPEWRQ